MEYTENNYRFRISLLNLGFNAYNVKKNSLKIFHKNTNINKIFLIVKYDKRGWRKTDITISFLRDKNIEIQSVTNSSKSSPNIIKNNF